MCIEIPALPRLLFSSATAFRGGDEDVIEAREGRHTPQGRRK
jgi:hypothetical protein